MTDRAKSHVANGTDLQAVDPVSRFLGGRICTLQREAKRCQARDFRHGDTDHLRAESLPAKQVSADPRPRVSVLRSAA